MQVFVPRFVKNRSLIFEIECKYTMNILLFPNYFAFFLLFLVILPIFLIGRTPFVRPVW